jgi:hypothetical protein
MGQSKSISKSNTNGPLPLRILCFGDSLTAGYTRRGAVYRPYGHELRKHLCAAFPAARFEVEDDGVPGEMAVSEDFIGRMREKCEFRCWGAGERGMEWDGMRGRDAPEDAGDEGREGVREGEKESTGVRADKQRYRAETQTSRQADTQSRPTNVPNAQSATESGTGRSSSAAQSKL